MANEIVVPAQPVTPERLERIKAIPTELMQAAVALVHSSERYDLNRALNFAQLAAGQAIIDLLAEVEGLTASRNYGRDIINDMALEASDDQKQLARQDELIDKLRTELLSESPRVIVGWLELSGLPVYEDTPHHVDAEGCYFTESEWKELLADAQAAALPTTGEGSRDE